MLWSYILSVFFFLAFEWIQGVTNFFYTTIVYFPVGIYHIPISPQRYSFKCNNSWHNPLCINNEIFIIQSDTPVSPSPPVSTTPPQTEDDGDNAKRVSQRRKSGRAVSDFILFLCELVLNFPTICTWLSFSESLYLIFKFDFWAHLCRCMVSIICTTFYLSVCMSMVWRKSRLDKKS